MILYENSVKNYIDAMKSRNLIPFISDEFTLRVGRKISQETRNEWKYTLEVLKQIISEAEVNDDCGIRIDYVIIDSTRRFEVIIAGDNGKGTVIHVIELLPWENARDTDELDMIEYFIGDGEAKKCVHPSYQSISYKRFLPIKNQNVDIHSYVYLFECNNNSESKSLIEAYSLLTDEATIYFAEEQEKVIDRLAAFKSCSNGRNILNLFHERDQLSSEGVDAFLSGILSDEERNILTEEQKTILASVIKESDNDCEALLLIDGAAGTGKTMLAISCIVELIKRNKKVAYITPMKVQGDMLREKLSKKIDATIDIETITKFRVNQTKQFQQYDVVFVDESQMLLTTFGKRRMSSNLQMIFESAKIVVCLYSSMQTLTGEPINDKKLKKYADKIGKKLYQYNLNNNLRYSGSGSGISWLSHQFQIMDTGNYEDWDFDKFEISVADSPGELFDLLKEKANNGCSARALVRYSRLSELHYDEDGDDLYYIVEGENYNIPVCTSQSSIIRDWMSNDSYIEYAAGPNIIQGLELEYAGVFIGRELFYDKESGTVCSDKNNPLDIHSLKRAYYILLSRGMKGVILFIEDPSLKKYICDRLVYSQRRFSWIKELAEKYAETNEKSFADAEKKNTYSYVLQIYEAINDFVSELKHFSEEQLDESTYRAISDKCSELLLKMQSEPLSERDISEKYERIIIDNMGQAAWDKLSTNSRRCLISSELTYHDMKDYNQLYDFSAVCVQVSKAVEFEMTRRFFEYYVGFLECHFEKNEHPDEFLDKLPGALKVNDRRGIRLRNEKEVMLGTIPFIVGIDANGTITDQYTYDCFEKYAIANLLISSEHVKETLAKHIEYIIRIKNDYRNKAAHKTPMDVVTARACLDYVIEVQRTLGKILDDCQK